MILLQEHGVTGTKPRENIKSTIVIDINKCKVKRVEIPCVGIRSPRIRELANRFRAWGPAAAWAALLFFLSALPAVSSPARLPFGDKIGHFALYAVLGLLLAWGRSRAAAPVAHVILIAIGALYGLTDEWHQMFVPGRVPDVADWIADVAGFCYGFLMSFVLAPGGWQKVREKLQQR